MVVKKLPEILPHVLKKRGFVGETGSHGFFDGGH